MFDRASRIERRFRRIAESIRPFHLQELEEEPRLTEGELVGDLRDHRGSSRFLGYYSRQGIRRALEAYGITSDLSARGIKTLRIEIDVADAGQHRLRVFGALPGTRDELLIDFATHIGHAPNLLLGGRRAPPLLVIDWLLLQNPFAPHRPGDLLPGQRFPGLGIGLEIGTLIGQIARRLELAGCLAVPAWYHNAVMYSLRYTFVEPAVEGRFLALQRDARGLSIGELSWALELGCVREIETVFSARHRTLSEPVRWQGRSQLWPLTPELDAIFHAPAWLGVRDAVCDGVRFFVDLERLRKLRPLPQAASTD